MPLPRGITDLGTCYRARLRVNGREFSRCFPYGTPPDEIMAWRRHTRADAERDRLPVWPPGSFAADAERYLKLRLTMPTYRERAQHIAEWVAIFGHQPRDHVTPAMIQAVREQWLTRGPKRVQRWQMNPPLRRKTRYFELVETPLSASAVNHRLRALENLFTLLGGGRHAPNPVRGVHEAEEPESPPRALALGVVREVLGIMPDSVAKAWLSVFAATGTPHKSIARMTRAMVDLDARTMWVPGRKKGKGTSGRLVPLTTDGVAAWRLFVREDAWRATPPQGNMARAWRAACRRVIKAHPADAELRKTLQASRVYDLRHSVGTLVALAGGTVAAMDVLGVTMPTARRYAKAALNPQLLAAVARLELAQQAGERPPDVAGEVADVKKPEG